MATKDEENTANTVPCSVMLTDEKIYVCHDEQDNSLIRQLDSIKLEYVARLLVDPHYQYYCVIVSTSFSISMNDFCFDSLLNMVFKDQNLGFSIFYLPKKWFNLLKLYKKLYRILIRLFSIIISSFWKSLFSS
jgi:hypothetical protein